MATAIPMIRSRSDPPTLDELIRRVARLRPCWTRPEAFFEERSDLVHDLRRLARQGASEGLETRTRVPLVPPRERRLVTLARALASEIDRLRALLAAAARPPPRRRRRPPDHRQLLLEL